VGREEGLRERFHMWAPNPVLAATRLHADCVKAKMTAKIVNTAMFMLVSFHYMRHMVKGDGYVCLRSSRYHARSR
jgi:hypothetical protein